jgi:hypothetical protein
MVQVFLYLISALILFGGLAGAAFVFLTAADENKDGLSYEFVDGHVFVIAPGDSKRYRHDLERFGGKSAVLADDFNRWFVGLWQGRKRAYTWAVLAMATALPFFGSSPFIR